MPRFAASVNKRTNAQTQGVNMKDRIAVVRAAVATAYAADDAYDAVVKAHGYKSRWDVPNLLSQPRAMVDAYFAKQFADKALRDARNLSQHKG